MKTQALHATGTELPVYKEHIDLTAHQFAEAVEDAWHCTPLQTKDGFGRVFGDLWAVDDWLFSEVRMAPMLFSIDPHHLQDAGSVLNLGRCVRGEHRGLFHSGEPVVTTPDVLEFGDRQTRYRSVTTEQITQDLTFPRRVLGVPDGQAVRLQKIHKTTAAGRMVFCEWDNLFDTLRRGPSDVPREMFDRFAACLKIALGVNPQREDVRRPARQALMHQICLFIENNLDDSDLSVAMLLGRFGVSRPTLYRMSEPLGGVRNYLTYRRALAALFDLSVAQSERGAVARVCERWQFSTPSNFNKSIQRLFGNSPGALLGLNGPEDIVDRRTTSFKKSFISDRYNLGDDQPPTVAAA